MAQPNAAEAAEPGPDTETPAEDASEGSTFIELEIKADGTMAVSMESGQEEAAEEAGGQGEQKEAPSTPAKNIDDACRIIKQIYQQVSGATPGPAAQSQEDQAYQAEMAK